MEIILKTNKFPKPIFISLFPPLPTYYYPLFIPPYLLSFPFSSLFLLNHMFTPSYLLSFLFLSPPFFFPPLTFFSFTTYCTSLSFSFFLSSFFFPSLSCSPLTNYISFFLFDLLS